MIDACITKADLNFFFVFLLLVSATAWLIDIFIGITEVLQSVYNLKFAHYFKKMIACKSMDMDYKETESAETLDNMERAYDVVYDLSGSQITDFLTDLFIKAYNACIHCFDTRPTDRCDNACRRYWNICHKQDSRKSQS